MKHLSNLKQKLRKNRRIQAIRDNGLVILLSLIAALSFMMTLGVIKSYAPKIFENETCETKLKEEEMMYITNYHHIPNLAGVHNTILYTEAVVIDNENPKSTTGMNMEEVEEVVEVNPWADLATSYVYDKHGYITATKLNVRKFPSTEEEVIDTLYYLNEVNYALTEVEGWYAVPTTDGSIGYVSAQFVSDTQIDTGTWFDVYGDDYTRKSYMDWEKITNKRSRQWRLELMAYTNEDGIRMVNDRFLIATGQYYTNKIGTYIDVYLNNGQVLKCILGDSKQWRHTQGSNGLVGADGGAVEFIVETDDLSSLVKKKGSISYVDEKYLSRVIGIKVYNKNILD